MPSSHALISAVTCTDEQVPGLLDVLAQVTDPRRRRGRFTLVFVLAVAVTCALAGAKNLREIGDQAGDLPQERKESKVKGDSGALRPAVEVG